MSQASRSSSACLLGLALIWGCSYTSEYVPPQDGRARAVWQSNNVVLSTGGVPPGPQCLADVLAMTDSERLRLSRAEQQAQAPGGGPFVSAPMGGFWVPRYYGPLIVVVNPRLAPILPRPPLFLPGLSRVIWPVPVPIGGGGVHIGGGGGGGGGGKGGEALVILAVVALVVLPAVDLGLALTPPESPQRSSNAIDQANALNDLRRSDWTSCSAQMAAVQGGAP